MGVMTFHVSAIHRVKPSEADVRFPARRSGVETRKSQVAIAMPAVCTAGTANWTGGLQHRPMSSKLGSFIRPPVEDLPTRIQVQLGKVGQPELRHLDVLVAEKWPVRVVQRKVPVQNYA